jgi:DNA-binding NarL/FixJ family response regulator
MDPCPLVRLAMERLVHQLPGMSVAGFSASASETLTLQATLQPDVVTLEFAERDGASLDLVKDLLLRQSRVRILVVSSLPELVLGPRALRAGAHGFISKRSDPKDVSEALRTVAAGRRYLTHELSIQLARLYLGGEPISDRSMMDQLSDRQLQVFRLIGQGHSIRSIAEGMVLSIKTVETHVGHLKRKLGVDSGRSLVHRAVRWVDGAEPG